jgi:DNA-binding beta-propeller fold protein YncE
MKNIISVFCMVLIFSGILSLNAQTIQPGYKISNRIHLEGDGGWDYLTVDAPNNRLFVSHSTMVQVVDLEKGTLLATIADTKGVHGIALATDLNKGFISCGKDSSVVVFDLATYKVIERVKVTGANPDAILYDPYRKIVFTFNGRSSNATVLDATSNKVISTIPLAGKPEYSASDKKGKVYVNIEDKSLVTVINTKTLKVENSWSLAPGEEPSGLALDNETHRLFLVCSNKLMVVMNALTGKVITTLPIGDRCDGVAFDPATKRAFSSNGDGTMTVVQENANDSYTVVENVATQKSARTIAVNSMTHKLYMTAAEFEAAVGNARPAIKPGTFVILEVEPVK